MLPFLKDWVKAEDYDNPPDKLKDFYNTASAFVTSTKWGPTLERTTGDTFLKEIQLATDLQSVRADNPEVNGPADPRREGAAR